MFDQLLLRAHPVWSQSLHHHEISSWAAVLWPAFWHLWGQWPSLPPRRRPVRASMTLSSDDHSRWPHRTSWPCGPPVLAAQNSLVQWQVVRLLNTLQRWPMDRLRPWVPTSCTAS